MSDYKELRELSHFTDEETGTQRTLDGFLREVGPGLGHWACCIPRFLPTCWFWVEADPTCLEVIYSVGLQWENSCSCSEFCMFWQPGGEGPISSFSPGKSLTTSSKTEEVRKKRSGGPHEKFSVSGHHRGLLAMEGHCSSALVMVPLDKFL
jgi:hypothetical protein